MLEIRTVPASLFGANCYVMWDDKERSALVVDPGPGTTEQVLEHLRDEELTLGAILLTHGHADHTWEAQQLSDAAGSVPVLLPEPDMFFMEDPAGILGVIAEKFGMGQWRKPDRLEPIKDLAFEPVAGVNVRMVPAPGHSPGSSFYLLGNAGLSTPLALSGDVVFAGTVGRTDLPGGDEQEMRESLRTLAAVIDPDTTLLPGHGPQATWRNELETNPYVMRAVQKR